MSSKSSTTNIGHLEQRDETCEHT